MNLARDLGFVVRVAVRRLRTRRGFLIALLVLRGLAPLYAVINVDTAFAFAPKALPLRGWVAEPGLERLQFEATPGTIVRGYELRQRAPRAFVLYFYGNGDQMQRDLPFLRWMRGAARVDVCVYDYRGSGYSDGTLSVDHVFADALAEYDRIAALAVAAHRPVIVYGYSLGAGAATYVAVHRRPAGVVLQSPPSDADREIAYASRAFALPIEILGVRANVSDDARRIFDDTARARAIFEPLLVMHGTADHFVPYAGGRALFDAAASHDKRFVPLPGLDHTGWIPPTAGGRAVVAFISRIAALPERAEIPEGLDVDAAVVPATVFEILGVHERDERGLRGRIEAFVTRS